jgi:hypothetical protein
MEFKPYQQNSTYKGDSMNEFWSIDIEIFLFQVTIVILTGYHCIEIILNTIRRHK